MEANGDAPIRLVRMVKQIGELRLAPNETTPSGLSGW
jgi:hypothetical protein